MSNLTIEDVIGDINKVIVFDTNVLLDVLKIDYDSAEELINLFNLLSDKVWIPSTVLKEYNNNKHKVSSRTYKDEQFTNEIKKHIAGTRNLKNTIGDKARKLGIDNQINDELNLKADEIQVALEQLKNSIKSNENSRKIRANQILDKLEECIEKFKKFEDIKMSEIIEIIKEGEVRYEYNIPPGYKDIDKEKESKSNKIRKFGDLFIWKEILNLPIFLNNENLEIIFITKDLKEDWVDKNKKIRPELEKEFKGINKNSTIDIIPLDAFLMEFNLYGRTNTILLRTEIIEDDYKEELRYLFYNDTSDSYGIYKKIAEDKDIEHKIQLDLWPQEFTNIETSIEVDFYDLDIQEFKIENNELIIFIELTMKLEGTHEQNDDEFEREIAKYEATLEVEVKCTVGLKNEKIPDKLVENIISCEPLNLNLTDIYTRQCGNREWDDFGKYDEEDFEDLEDEYIIAALGQEYLEMLQDEIAIMDMFDL